MDLANKEKSLVIGTKPMVLDTFFQNFFFFFKKNVTVSWLHQLTKDQGGQFMAWTGGQCAQEPPL